MRITFSKKAVHGVFEDVQFVLYGEVDEVGIEEKSIWGAQCGIVHKEHTGWLFGSEWVGKYSSLISTSSGAGKLIA